MVADRHKEPRYKCLLLAAVIAIGSVVAVPKQLAAQSISSFPVPVPASVMAGPDGALWFT